MSQNANSSYGANSSSHHGVPHFRPTSMMDNGSFVIVKIEPSAEELQGTTPTERRCHMSKWTKIIALLLIAGAIFLCIFLPKYFQNRAMIAENTTDPTNANLPTVD